MIYSASRRTDLVAFYPDFIVTKVKRSRKLDGIVFWTKDPRNLVTHPELRAVVRDCPAIIQLTITGMAGTGWEPAVPRPQAMADALAELSAMLPPGAIIWRFDPIIDTPDLLQRFDSVLSLLAAAIGRPDEFVTSFVDAYSKVIRRLARFNLQLPQTTMQRQRDIVRMLCNRSGLEARLCCEPELLTLEGVKPACCIDARRFDRLYGTAFGLLPKDYGQRRACNCMRSTDIGSYQQACGHQCRYCYARPLENPPASS